MPQTEQEKAAAEQQKAQQEAVATIAALEAKVKAAEEAEAQAAQKLADLESQMATAAATGGVNAPSRGTITLDHTGQPVKG